MVIFHSYVSLPEGNRILMVIQWWFNGDLMVINPLVMEYEWLIGGFKHLDYVPFHIWDVILPIDFHIFQDG